MSVFTMLPDLIPLTPYLREMIWGGRSLAGFGKDLPPGISIGESWEISALSGMESRVTEGPLAGSSLDDLTEDYGADLLGSEVHDRYGGKFPLLIKLIDARDNLSIQVHPDDGYVRGKSLGSFGKMEAWYVLRSEGGRIACGLKPGVGREELLSAILDEGVEDVVAYHDVDEGDVVFLPPGTIHALCSGVMIYEVQQASDLTFRIYDYGRKGADGKPRELHIDQALDVIRFDGSPGPRPSVVSSRSILVESEHFRLERFKADGDPVAHAPVPSFRALTVINGAGDISGDHSAYSARIGNTFLIPAGRGFSVLSSEGAAEYLVSSVP